MLTTFDETSLILRVDWYFAETYLEGTLGFVANSLLFMKHTRGSRYILLRGGERICELNIISF